jgi:predicted RNA-binding protein with PUA-like domain
MGYWIFQGKPSRYDVATQLIEGNIEEWTAYQNNQDMKVGDIVFLWRAAEKERAKRGVYGWGEIVREPELDEDTGYWVAVKYICKFPKYIPFEKLEKNTKFNTHQLFRFAIGTNFKVSRDQYEGLKAVISNELGQNFIPDGGK